MKLGLGAVQFGMAYGVANPGGRTPPAEVARILDLAAAEGIDLIDTAPGYGDSEAVLGRAMAGRFRVVTKTPALAGRPAGELADELEASLHRSLAALGLPAVHGLLVHRVDDLLAPGGERLWQRLQALRAQGLVRRIGASVYAGEQIDRLLARTDIDLVQLPLSVLDQRLLHGGQIARLKQRGVEIHARSIFLQGLVLMEPAGLPPALAPLRGHLEACRRAWAETGLEPLAAALAFIRGIAEIDVALCGVNDHRQLGAICAAWTTPVPALDYGRFASDDARFVNPANWKLS